jgi:hypothetical protein
VNFELFLTDRGHCGRHAYRYTTNTCYVYGNEGIGCKTDGTNIILQMRTKII